MRGPVLCAACVAAVACGGRSTEISGDLADGEHADSVWHFGGDARVPVEDDSFRIDGLGGDLIDLRFVDDDGLHARMEIRDAGGGAIHLRGIWTDAGAAYASGVRMDRRGTVTINGVRMADPERIPEEVDAPAVVLAASRSGDALLVRPDDRDLPDLRVVVTPATSVTSPDGDPVDPDAVEPGDTVTVRGRTEGGYLVASEVVVPRRSAARNGGGGADRGDRGGGENARGDARGESERSGGVSEDERSDKRGRGRGRGKGKGRGRGNH